MINLQKNSEKNATKVKNHDQIEIIGRGDQSSYGKEISSMIDKNSKELRDIQTS